VVSPIGSNLRKLNTGAQLQTLPYPTCQNRLCTQRLHGEIGRTISDVQKRDEQTNKQTNQRFLLPRRRVKSEPTKLGTMTEDLKHVLAPLKLLGV